MSDIERITDAELVAAYLTGDRRAFAGIYDRYAGRIFSYNLTMLRDRKEAADATHDAFIEAATRLEQLESPEKLRPWLFAVARNEAHARWGHRATAPPEKDLPEAGAEPALAMGAKQAELREQVWAAADGLDERDQQLLALHLTEGLEGEELAEAMGVETSHVHVSQMRDRVEKAIGPLLIARLGCDECEELPSILGDWDGVFGTGVRSRVARHVEKCDTCRARTAVLLAPAEVLPGIMVVPAPVGLRARVLDEIDRGVAPSAVSGLPAHWVKLGIFAAVTLVVGLIGLAVSAQFEPIQPPPTPPIVEAPPGADDTTTTAADSTTTTSDATSTTAPSTPTAASATPAAIEVSTDTVDFGGDGTVDAFDLVNSGGQLGEWTLVSSNDAISVSAGSGQIAGGESVTIDLGLDRNRIEEGEVSETLTITWSGGEIPISVVGTNEANPIIHNPRASPPSVAIRTNSPDCSNNQSTISARVRDASPLESVVVRWSPDGTAEQETPMEAVGNDMFEAVVGPFTSVHTATVRIVAFDERGNAGGATTQLAVVECP